MYNCYQNGLVYPGSNVLVYVCKVGYTKNSRSQKLKFLPRILNEKNGT